MPMTLGITRNVPARFHGFLASCMLELAPGIYAAPDISHGVRDRIWQVIQEWSELIPVDGGIMIVWYDRDSPSGLAIRTLGWPKKEILEIDGLWLAADNLTAMHDEQELRKLAAPQNIAEQNSTDTL